MHTDVLRLITLIVIVPTVVILYVRVHMLAKTLDFQREVLRDLVQLLAVKAEKECEIEEMELAIRRELDALKNDGGEGM